MILIEYGVSSSECDLETSTVRKPRPTRVCRDIKKTERERASLFLSRTAGYNCSMDVPYLNCNWFPILWPAAVHKTFLPMRACVTRQEGTCQDSSPLGLSDLFRVGGIVILVFHWGALPPAPLAFAVLNTFVYFFTDSVNKSPSIFWSYYTVFIVWNFGRDAGSVQFVP